MQTRRQKHESPYIQESGQIPNEIPVIEELVGSDGRHVEGDYYDWSLSYFDDTASL